MKRRVVILTILFSLLLIFYLLPQSSFGRALIVNRAQNILLESGYYLEFEESRGNPWLGINFAGVLLQGKGVDVTLEHFKLVTFCQLCLGVNCRYL